MDDDLKPCLQCKNDNPKMYREGSEYYYVQCSCGICTVVCMSEEIATEIWNNRE